MQNDTEARLRRIRGPLPPKRHTARTIAALTGNPGCARRAVLDSAGVDKGRLADAVGHPAPFGQSRFAISRGNSFEARVKADGCAALLALLGELLGVDLTEVEYTDLDGTGAGDQDLRHARARAALCHAASRPSGDAGPDRRDFGGTTEDSHDPGGTTDDGWHSDGAADDGHDSGGTTDDSPRLPAPDGPTTRASAGDGAGGGHPDGSLFDHPLLRLEVAGQSVHLEPDLVAFQLRGVFHVVEIKSFAMVDGQADADKVAAAAIQSAVYVLALRRMLGRPDAVSDRVVLVCPKDFTNTPTAALVDVRRQLLVLEHQLARLSRIDALLDGLPEDLSLDPGDPAAGRPGRPPERLLAALGWLPARYTPDCLSHCELSYLCRAEATGSTAALGVSVREELGGVDTVAEVLGLAEGTLQPDEDRSDAAVLLRTAARAYADAVDSARLCGATI